MPCTLKDVAKAAGVGVSTASYVLSGKGLHKISPSTQKHILDTAQKLGYRVNLAGRLLHGGASKIIGIFEEYRSVAIFSNLMQLVCRELKARGYETYYRTGIEGPTAKDQEQEAINDFMSHGVDGIIFAYFNQQGHFSREKCPVPSTVFDGDDYDIRVNLKQCAYVVAKHLLEHGHRKIGYLLPDDQHNVDKLAGYRQALQEFGVEVQADWLIKVYPTPNWEQEINEKIKNHNLTAICCSNDFYAIKLMTYLQWKGYKVPEDIAITGFDGISLVDSLQIPLTTVIQPVNECAISIANTMIRKIEENNMTRLDTPLQLDGQLHIGNSCGCTKHCKPEINWEATTLHYPPMQTK